MFFELWKDVFTMSLSALLFSVMLQTSKGVCWTSLQCSLH